MKRETIKKNRIHAAEKKEYYTEREKYWARLEQEADDAEAMKIIRKKHITLSDGTLWEAVTADCFRQFPLPDRAA